MLKFKLDSKAWKNETKKMYNRVISFTSFPQVQETSNSEIGLLLLREKSRHFQRNSFSHLAVPYSRYQTKLSCVLNGFCNNARRLYIVPTTKWQPWTAVSLLLGFSERGIVVGSMNRGAHQRLFTAEERSAHNVRFAPRCSCSLVCFAPFPALPLVSIW